MADLVHILWWVDVWNITRVEDIVDVFKEGFTFDLQTRQTSMKYSVFRKELLPPSLLLPPSSSLPPSLLLPPPSLLPPLSSAISYTLWIGPSLQPLVPLPILPQYLCISEQEHNGLVLKASLHQTLPQVLLPLGHTIVLGQLYLETVILRSMGKENILMASHTETHRHMHRHMHALTYTHTCIDTCMHSHHTHTCIDTCMHSHTHTHTLVYRSHVGR